MTTLTRLLLLGVLVLFARLGYGQDDPLHGEVVHDEEVPPEEEKKLDLLIWGATGFTGKLAAEYLVNQYGASPSSFTWGIGGRSLSKLNKLKEDLVAFDPKAVDIPVVVGDATDPESITNVVRSTRVVATTAGPYAEFGTELVAACVREGVHYADLTGETLWMSEMISKYHEEAVKNHVKIVHTAGFDSIPSDIGTLMVVSYIKEKFNRSTREVKMIVADTAGGLSGGTVASLFGQMDAATSSPETWKKFKHDAYLLNPPNNKPAWDEGHGGLGYDITTGYFHGPFIMAPINARVVRRSNALQDNAYGSPFHYSEVSGGKGIGGLLKAVISSAISSAVGPLLRFSRTRQLIAKVLPKPGEGPTREVCDTGYFWAYITGEAATGPGEEPIKVVGRLGSDLGDPGYKETAHMLVEAGLALALDQSSTPERYGVLTPASALGHALLKRLRNTGMTFEMLPPGSKLPDNIRQPAEGVEKEVKQEL